MSEQITNSPNKTLLIYHTVCLAKCRKDVFSREVEEILKERYEINIIEIGSDDNHVHFLVQRVSMLSTQRIQKIKVAIIAGVIDGK